MFSTQQDNGPAEQLHNNSRDKLSIRELQLSYKCECVITESWSSHQLMKYRVLPENRFGWKHISLSTWGPLPDPPPKIEVFNVLKRDVVKEAVPKNEFYSAPENVELFHQCHFFRRLLHVGWSLKYCRWSVTSRGRGWHSIIYCPEVQLILLPSRQKWDLCFW